MVRTLAALVGVALSAQVFASSPELLQTDDECLVGECGLSALQRQAAKSEDDSSEDGTDATLHSPGGWTWGGDKVWGWGPVAGHGVEDISTSNVDFYDKGMKKALSHCGGPGCSLIMNAPHHRSKEVPHIHAVPLNSTYGDDLHKKLERKTCGSTGEWKKGGLPCNGKAAFFSGFSDVLENAMTSGDLAHASVMVWPYSCGGSGTIIETAYHCSIEHQIRGDFDASRR